MRFDTHVARSLLAAAMALCLLALCIGLSIDPVHAAFPASERAGMVGALGTTDAVTAAEPSTIVSDDFSTCTLNGGLWSVVDPVGDGGLRLAGGRAELSVPGGVRHDIWAGNDALRIMQAANDTDFQVEVKFESGVQAAYALQGILIEQDDANFLRFDFYGDGANTRLFAARFTNGSPSFLYNGVVAAGNAAPLFLRISRVGAQWSQTYSLDGESWIQAALFEHDLAVSAAGVFAGNAGANPAHTAVVDYFFNTAAPIAPEDGAIAQFTLTADAVGSGSVAADPSRASYACGETVNLTAAPAVDWLFDGWSGDLSIGLPGSLDWYDEIEVVVQD